MAPLRMMPPYSCCTPGRNPGTSTNVTSGMLNALQKRMNRLDLIEALMSIAPESTEGWLAMMPIERPRIRPKPTTMFGA